VSEREGISLVAEVGTDILYEKYFGIQDNKCGATCCGVASRLLLSLAGLLE
jgi:hypothetical protein